MIHKLHKQYRLPEFNYASEGGYFVTICTKEHQLYFGDIINSFMELSPIGNIAKRIWLDIPVYFNNVELDEWIIMPNHIHGIIMINTDDGDRNLINQIPTEREFKSGIKNNPMELKENTLGKIVRWFKGRAKFETNKNEFQYFAWQSRFYDHVIRDDKSLNTIRQYIIANPERWATEKNSTENLYM